MALQEAQTVKNQRILTKTEYDNLSSAPDKVKNLEKVAKQIFKWEVLDLLNTDQEVNKLFVVDPVKYGNGYGIITSGIADVQNFNQSPENRWPQDVRLLKDYVDKIDYKVDNVIRVDYRGVELKTYFKNFETYSKWIGLNYKRVRDTINLLLFNFFKGVFGGTVDEKVLSTNLLLHTKMNEIKTAIKNNVTYTVTGDEKDNVQMFKKVIQTYSEMLIQPSDKWHGDTAATGFMTTTQPENMVLVASYLDKIQFDTDYRASAFAPQYFQLPDIKTIWLDIPQGTCYLLDKRALQIAPFFDATYTKFIPGTLETMIYHHFQFFVGTFGLYNFVKISKQG